MTTWLHSSCADDGVTVHIQRATRRTYDGLIATRVIRAGRVADVWDGAGLSDHDHAVSAFDPVDGVGPGIDPRVTDILYYGLDPSTITIGELL